MSEENKYKGIYRIPPARWQDWDYGANAAYFVTICTEHREHFFGNIADDKMTLSQIGEIVQSEWLKTPELRQDMNLWLDEYVIMPNHFHGIIVIGENQYNTDNMVQTQCDNVQQPHQWQTNKFGVQSHNLPSIIRGFKSAVTKYANINAIPFAWQTRFYDHVIRNYGEYNRIAHYIKTNIENWHDDELYK
jgi:REP element-mobilizing transposase RayT